MTIDDLIAEYQRLGERARSTRHTLQSGQDDIRQSDRDAAAEIETRVDAIVRQIDDLIAYMERVRDTE